MSESRPTPPPVHPLRPFPGTPGARHELGVSCQRTAAGLAVVFELEGSPGSLRLPAPAPAPAFTDGLWQHSCFELFLACPGEAAYREFNFAPSGHWAAYAFSAYRERIAWHPPVAPGIVRRQTADGVRLELALPAALLPAGQLEASATAVLESCDASLSYWALLHAGERPDFHLRASFILNIPGLSA